MVSINEFTETVQEYLLAKYPEIEKTYCKAVHKNNNVVLHGIAVKEHSSNLSPMIYIDDFYRKLLGGASLDMVCDQIASVFETGRLPQIDMGWFKDVKQVREMLSVKLINQKDNQQILKEVPYFEYGDLAGIYQINVSKFIGTGASITVKNEHISFWDISPEQLHQCAMQNCFMDMENQEYTIRSMIDIFRTNFSDFPEMNDPALSGPQMYVLSNKNMLNGAAGILNTDLLQKFSEQIGSNLIVLPSSIHEVILLPDHDCDMKEMIEMVTEINKYDVEPEDRLSDNVYFYDKEKQVLCQGTEKKPMQIKIHHVDQNREQTSVLGKLRSNQKDLQQPDKEKVIKEYSQPQTERG